MITKQVNALSVMCLLFFLMYLNVYAAVSSVGVLCVKLLRFRLFLNLKQSVLIRDLIQATLTTLTHKLLLNYQRNRTWE